MNEPVVLLTGFEPFGGDTVNPSLDIVRALDGALIEGHRIAGAGLPTVFADTVGLLETLLAEKRPRLVLALGLADKRQVISLERVAINLIDARIADNSGAQPVDVRIVEEAPDAYFSTLPVKAMAQRLREAHIPVELSQSAGTFVCNQVFFALMHLLAQRHPGVRGGFVHVPHVPQAAARAGLTGMPLATMIDAVRLLVQTALTTGEDLHYPAGSIQ
ncbi:MAG TPA: pyroglutamyl-peptidase I [Rudaea sp.]